MKQALNTRPTDDGLGHHSDRGVQYNDLERFRSGGDMVVIQTDSSQLGRA